jgi:LDH2 family malate/lactate/ureidoglycolate dehydrogenase
VYNKNGKPLPEQWALDREGKPAANAGDVLYNIIHKLGGGISPLGGQGELHGRHKGYGLGVIVEIFTAILSGGLTSNHINVTPGLNGICHYCMAVDTGIFGDRETVKKAMSVFLRELRDSKKADGQDRIYTHGEKEMETMASRNGGKFR